MNATTPHARLVLAAALAAATCAGSPARAAELIPDPAFKQGFAIKGLGRPDDDGGSVGTFRTENADAPPLWSIAQWASRPSLADPGATRQTQRAPHQFAISNATKQVVADTRTGEITLGITASASYPRPRQAGEPWPHLLIEVPLTPPHTPDAANRLHGMTALTASLSCQLLAFTDNHPNADPNLHAAQFQIFLVVQNLTRDSKGFGDMLWFGIPVLDNRHREKDEWYQRDTGKADATGKFIYMLPTQAARAGQGFWGNDGALATGEASNWVDIRADVLPHIRRAYALARANGFLPTTEWEDLYASGINLGWEMPGAYDATMTAKNLSLRSNEE